MKTLGQSLVAINLVLGSLNLYFGLYTLAGIGFAAVGVAAVGLWAREAAEGLSR